MNILIATLNQNDWWQRSFNVLVPLAIQGKSGVLTALGQSPNQAHGSIGHQVTIEGKGYNLPMWAVINPKTNLPVPPQQPRSMRTRTSWIPFPKFA